MSDPWLWDKNPQPGVSWGLLWDMTKSSDRLPPQKTITQNTKKPTSGKKITIQIFVHFFPRGGSHFFPLVKTFFSNVQKYTSHRIHFCLYMEDTKCESTYHTKVWYTPHNPLANQKRHSRLWLKHVLVTETKTMSWKKMVKQTLHPSQKIFGSFGDDAR